MRGGALVPKVNRTLSANLIVGSSIALFVYFLKESALLEVLLAFCARSCAWLTLFLVRNRFEFALSPLSLAMDAVCVLVCALVWSYVRSTSQRVGLMCAFALVLVPVSVAVYRSQKVIPTSFLLVAGIALAAAVEGISDLLSREIHFRLLDEKQEAEFSILGHLSHNVKPNLQIAKSPIAAVREFLDERGISGEVLAQRLDGSEETVGEALDKALLSLNQIAAILDNTKKLVTRQIRQEDFSEVALVPLLNSEVVPLYAGRLRISVTGNEQLYVRLHRESFVEAMNNLVRNAQMHAFNDPEIEPLLEFSVRETRRRVVVDYHNNGKHFPTNLSAKDFLSFGRKSNESPGEGLGGAWIGKMIEAHHGSFEIIRDQHPLHFRITLPKGGMR